MKRIAVALHEQDLIGIIRILADEDMAEALKFIKEVLEPKVKEAELPHCIPVFEESYNPGQAKAFEKKCTA